MTESPRGGLDLDRFRSARKPAEDVPATVVRNAPTAAGSLAIVERERRLNEILTTVHDLPALPDVVMKVLSLASDADAQARDFEALVRQDQALAAKVLKLVNSPFFALRAKVTSISQAVVVLGFKTLRSVVVAAKTSGLLSKKLAQYGLGADGMWEHSLSCATTAHLIARKAKLDAAAQEELFVAGLLHDVGKVVLAPHILRVQAEFDAELESNGGDVVRAEAVLIGASHDEVGGRMAGKWNLDATLQFLIAKHHDAEEAGPDARKLRVLQVANDLCNQLGVGRVAGEREPPPSFSAWLSALDLGDAETLKTEVRARLAEQKKGFDQMRDGPAS